MSVMITLKLMDVVAMTGNPTSETSYDNELEKLLMSAGVSYLTLCG